MAIDVIDVYKEDSLYVELRLFGDDFWDDLLLIKETIPHYDRDYDEGRKVWTIRNPEYHNGISEIDNAVMDYKDKWVDDDGSPGIDHPELEDDYWENDTEDLGSYDY